MRVLGNHFAVHKRTLDATVQRHLTASLGAFKFLAEIYRVAPGVITELRSSVPASPASQRDGRTVVFRVIRPTSDLLKWATKYGLHTSAPVLYAARILVNRWASPLGRHRHRRLSFAGNQTQYPWPAIDRKSDDALADIGASPNLQTWLEFRQVARRHYLARKAYDRRFQQPNKTRLEHFEWLAKRLFAKESDHAIAKADGHVAADAVRKGLRSAADSLGIELKPLRDLQS